MHAQIDQRAAAGAGLVAEPAAGVAVTADVVGLGVVKLAEVAGADEVLQHVHVIAVAADKTHHQQLAALLGGSHHLLGLLSVHRHGLFAQNMHTGIQCGNGALGVGTVPGTDGNSIQLLVLHHFVHIGVQMGDTVLFAFFLQALFVDIAERNDLHIGVGLVAADVHLGDAADADNAYFQLAHISFPP